MCVIGEGEWGQCSLCRGVWLSWWIFLEGDTSVNAHELQVRHSIYWTQLGHNLE